MIADYFVYRHSKLNVAGLYDPKGEYRYTSGFSVVAFSAFVVAVLPSLPGFLAATRADGWRSGVTIPSQSL